MSVGIKEATAGVIVVDPTSGVVTQWQSANDGNTYYFHQGSYNDVSNVVKTFTDDNAVKFALDGLTEPGGILPRLDSTASANTTDYIYFFAIGQPNASTISTYYILNPGSTWVQGSTNAWIRTDTTYSFNGTKTIYWASLSDPNSSVPEPSTAIAMGLLGVVGFAGRRRRRQVSAA